MKVFGICARLGALATALVATSGMASEVIETSAGPVLVEEVVGDLDNPWAVAFLPEEQLLITERDGRLWLIEPASENRRAVAGVPEVRARNQGGLLDVVPDPDFATNSLIYISYSEPVGLVSARTAVARARLDIDAAKLDGLEVIFRQTPDTRSGRHFGSRIVPDGAGKLYVTVGDRGDADLAQDPATTLGKVLLINADGSAIDNGVSGPHPEIWSIGHRNPQGAALDATGRLWTVSHGARGGDEINRPELGKNYGWPVISYGQHYTGGQIGEGTTRQGMEQPVFYWDPSIAPSGMMIYSGKLWPDWQGDIFVGSLKFDFLSRLDRSGDTIGTEERLFQDRFVRIRDVREGPDGAIWFLSVGDDALYRVTPSE